MAGLQIEYSKEIAKELTKIAVVLPGQKISVGDVITFPFGGSFFGPKPRGSFELVTTLNNLGINPDMSGDDPDGDPYVFASRKGVEVDFDIDASGGAQASGSLTAKFRKEGSVYFAAIDCTTKQLTNLAQVQIDLNQHQYAVIWKDTFVVTSVTTAAKALIMQSSTSSASLTVKGEVKGLVTGSGSDIDANATLSVSNFRSASFVKPWSDNVTVFIGLHRFKKSNFGYNPQSERSLFASQLVSDSDDTYELARVLPHEIFNESDLVDF